MLDIEKIEKEYIYEKEDLGACYKGNYTTFRVWSPVATRVDLKLYAEGKGDCLLETIPMMLDIKGTWYTKVDQDLEGKYYTYEITVQEETYEVVDVYAKAVGVNGKRGMIVDFSKTNPEGWEQDQGPVLKHYTDAILYELHVRDASMDSTSGIVEKGLWNGLAEENTKSPDGLSTGLAHIEELGVTHVHLLPQHDYGSVDEAHLEQNVFNWGYDPMNYNCLEGSYSSNPFDGAVRIKEMKHLIQTFHKHGLGVVFDVVYNHTYQSENSIFEQTVPGYYYRMKADGSFSNGSGCGNETASEHKMMGKYICDSVCFFAKEYHVDGFRFDLMAIHDIETMNRLAKQLKEINPNIIIYGEGWAAEEPLLEETRLAKKKNARKMPHIAMFSDNIRDAVKGHVFEVEAKGFVNGAADMEEEIKFAVVGATYHSQAQEGKEVSWAGTAGQCINYVSAHDDLTLWDKLALTNPDADEETRKAMNKLAAAIVYTSQGVPFMQAGEEMLRTKPGEEVAGKFTKNSYNKPDAINSLKWERKKTYADVVAYYQGLIAFRKAHKGLRMAEPGQIERHLQFLDLPRNVVGYTIQCADLEEKTKEILIIYNANNNAVTIPIPEGDWEVYIDGKQAGVQALRRVKGKQVSVDAISCIALLC